MSERELITLDTLLDDGYSVAQLVDRIEDDGLIYIDSFGRNVKANDETVQTYLDSLATHYKYENVDVRYAAEHIRDYWNAWGLRDEDFTPQHILSTAGWWDEGQFTNNSTPATGESQTNVSHSTPVDDLSNAFDPIPLSGIAKMFPLPIRTGAEESLDNWKKQANKASTNGLIKARINTGKGQAESTFNPNFVADWLVSKGHYARDHVVRILYNNLPPRSRHLKDL